MSDFSVVDLICAKRDGRALVPAEIAWFIDGYTNGRIPDEQASAMLMAIYFQAMDPDELATWTQAMIDSGERLDLSGLDRPTVDKHSTGGVGDKVSLVISPLLAACGRSIVMLTGRGLGHTAGTADKLEAVPGLRMGNRDGAGPFGRGGASGVRFCHRPDALPI